MQDSDSNLTFSSVLRKADRKFSAESQDRQIKVPSGLSQPLVGEAAVTATGTRAEPLFPIEAIPVELFQMIIWKAVDDPLSRSIQVYYYNVTQARLVCRRWTRVLEGMPDVWARLSHQMSGELIDLALARSMHSPLSIDVAGYEFSSPAVDKLLQHIDRWKYLDIYKVDDDVTAHLAGHSFPTLKELRLSSSSRNRLTIKFSGSAPMLRTVLVSDCRVQWSSSILSNLHELALLDINEGAPDIDTLLGLLSNSPQLIRLRVQRTHLIRSPSARTRITLSCLQHLELQTCLKTF